MCSHDDHDGDDMNTRRSLLQVVLGIACALIVAACGGAPSAAPIQTQKASEPTAAPAATKAPEPTSTLRPTSAPTRSSAPTTATPAATSAPAPTFASAGVSRATATLAAATTAPAASEATGVTTVPTNRVPATPTAAATELPSQVPAEPSKDQVTATVVATPEVTAVATPPEAPLPVENRLVELEWPEQMRMGDSDIARIALIPSQEGYTVTTEFAEHQAVTRTVQVQRPTGYDVSAVGRLDAAGFDQSPTGDQAQALPAGAPVTWRWTLTPRTAGQHRIVVSLLLRWTPLQGAAGAARESTIFSKGLSVNVTSLLGMTTSQSETTGLMGLVLGSGFGAFALASRRRPLRAILQSQTPNAALIIEPRPGLVIHPEEAQLLKTLFRRYARLVVESEFLSGYSGARTLLALPIRTDGRADAFTIAKIGDRESIRREFENYETYVKDTLPPITARIQEPPVMISPRATAQRRRQGDRSQTSDMPRAVLRYTFIGEPGRNPISLREALLAAPDPALLNKLFSTFGPNWWMQRRPYMFRLTQEYDRVLPAHYVIEPARGKAGVLDAQSVSAPRSWSALAARGDLVTLRGFSVIETRMDGKSLSLTGAASPGRPALRVRWLSTEPPNGAVGRVVSDRATLLREYVAGFDLCSLPDPLPRLQSWLDESVRGSQSTIHGDLNLENVLVGPGGFVWLIDFAQTRDGHVLYDFAHLEAEIIAQVIASHVKSPEEYLDILRANDHPLLTALNTIAANCLANPAQPREYQLALCLACIGALKFNNLKPSARHLLYLTAAHLGQTL